ncbi:activator-dependent family glycosyltransferase [Amycolatopsis magusensis]|uniref:activator-dependent family glycosyltransferase n=1 Tax=Amycolatopsis magusensis TaxID=882444 RepID=UPI0024A8A4B0|nr:activator-dependent family glycosyltransferase [Amycolatopsis magusensis]MDI5980591.1 activator-dependent family glycosyltransferase [Amycolatopsis magusensis]
MRVLFVTAAIKSHFTLLVPLAWALRAAGHEVRVASQPDIAGVIADSGLPAVPAGPALGLRRGKLLAGRPSGERLPFDVTEKRPEKLTWDHVRATLMVFPRMVSDVLACDAMLDDLVRFTARWRPDLVVWDALTYTGPVVAELCGAAHVRALFGPDHLARLRAVFLRLSADRELVGYDDPVRQWLTDRLHRYDRGASFDEDMVLGQATIDPMPPCVRTGAGTRTIPVRFVPHSGRAVVEDWLLDEPPRPLICLTLGTSSRDLGLPSPPLAELFGAVAGLDADVVATVTRAQSGVHHVPGNVRLTDFVPLDLLLPRCAAIVHHFGAGSVATAVVHGVPQLRVSDGVNLWGEPDLAACLVAEGAALNVDASDVTAGILADNLAKLLEDPGFRDNAARLRQQALAEPSPHDIVPTLEELAGA